MVVDEKNGQIVIKTALLTQSYLNEYFDKNNKKPLTFDKFMELQQKGFKDAKKLVK